MQNLHAEEQNTLSNSFFNFIGGSFFPSLAASAGLSGLILTPLCTETLYNFFLKIVLPKTAYIEFALWMTSFLITTHFLGQAFLPLLIAPIAGFGVSMTIGIGLELLATVFSHLFNSISSCLSP